LITKHFSAAERKEFRKVLISLSAAAVPFKSCRMKSKSAPVQQEVALFQSGANQGEIR
jgi:hypothetical protein